MNLIDQTIQNITIMKKLILSMLFCVGVGLSMMASPAQVCGDDNGGGKSIKSITRLADRNEAAVHHGRDIIKHEVKVKKNVDYSKVKAPKRVVSARDLSSWEDVGKSLTLIKKEPFPPIGGGREHGNSLPGLPGRNEHLLDIINNNPFQSTE